MGWRFRRTLSMGGFRGTISKQGLGGAGDLVAFSVLAYRLTGGAISQSEYREQVSRG